MKWIKRLLGEVGSDSGTAKDQKASGQLTNGLVKLYDGRGVRWGSVEHLHAANPERNANEMRLSQILINLVSNDQIDAIPGIGNLKNACGVLAGLYLDSPITRVAGDDGDKETGPPSASMMALIIERAATLPIYADNPDEAQGVCYAIFEASARVMERYGYTHPNELPDNDQWRAALGR